LLGPSGMVMTGRPPTVPRASAIWVPSACKTRGSEAVPPAGFLASGTYRLGRVSEPIIATSCIS
jgi:hypothetical protein